MLFPLSATAGDTALEGSQTWLGKVLFVFPMAFHSQADPEVVGKE